MYDLLLNTQILFADDFKKSSEKCKLDKACNKLSISSVNIQDAMKPKLLKSKNCNESQIEVKENGASKCKEKAISGNIQINNQ